MRDVGGAVEALEHGDHVVRAVDQIRALAVVVRGGEDGDQAAELVVEARPGGDQVGRAVVAGGHRTPSVGSSAREVEDGRYVRGEVANQPTRPPRTGPDGFFADRRRAVAQLGARELQEGLRAAARRTVHEPHGEQRPGAPQAVDRGRRDEPFGHLPLDRQAADEADAEAGLDRRLGRLRQPELGDDVEVARAHADATQLALDHGPHAGSLLLDDQRRRRAARRARRRGRRTGGRPGRTARPRRGGTARTAATGGAARRATMPSSTCRSTTSAITESVSSTRSATCTSGWRSRNGQAAPAGAAPRARRTRPARAARRRRRRPRRARAGDRPPPPGSAARAGTRRGPPRSAATVRPERSSSVAPSRFSSARIASDTAGCVTPSCSRRLRERRPVDDGDERRELAGVHQPPTVAAVAARHRPHRVAHRLVHGGHETRCVTCQHARLEHREPLRQPQRVDRPAPRHLQLLVPGALDALVALEQLLVELLAGPDARSTRISTGRLPDSRIMSRARSHDRAPGSPMSSTKMSPRLADAAGLEHELRGLGDRHEVARHLARP